MAIKKIKRQDGTEAWHAEVYVGRATSQSGKEVSRYQRKTFDLKRQAEKFVRDVEGRKEDPEYNHAGHKTPFSQVVGLWRETVRYADFAPRTRRGYEQHIDRYLIPAFGSTAVGSITVKVVEGFNLKLMRDGVGATTRTRVLATLSSILSEAVKAKLLIANPCHGAKKPAKTGGKREMLFLSAGEVAKLADAIHPHYRVLVIFAAWTGLRFSEIAALEVRDLTLPAEPDTPGRVKVARAIKRHDVGKRPEIGVLKNGDDEGRTVPIQPDLVPILRDHIAERQQAAGSVSRDLLVFTDDRPESAAWGGYIEHRRLYRVWFLKAVRKALPEYARVAPTPSSPATPGLRLHDLRHSFASLAHAAGASLLQVQKWLGHASVELTAKTYSHVFEEVDDRVMRSMAAMRTSATEPNVIAMGERRSA
jgi:integrase